MRPSRQLVLYVLFLGVIASCGPAPRRLEPDNLLWPLPPDQPRIKYIQSIFNEDDIGRVYSTREKMFGKEYFDGMVRPYGVSARKGKLYVADIILRRVLVFDLITKRLFSVGQEGACNTPSAVSAGADGTIYVADSGGSKIVVYNGAGSFRTSYPLPGSRPVGLAISEALGRLYVVDRVEHRVLVLGLDGKKLFEFGAKGVEDGKFNIPLDVAIDSQGVVYVLDNGNFRVQRFTADGNYLSKFGMVGDRAGMFANPKGIAIDSEDHIYVTDAAFNNFQIFDRDGNVLLFVGEMGSWPAAFQLPAGIAIDEIDRIYVADQLNSRIQVFQYLKEQ